MSGLQAMCKLFFNTLSYVQIGIFSGHCHGVSSMDHIYHMIGSNTMKKFVSLTSSYKTDSIRKMLHILYKYAQNLVHNFAF
jgi:hypothetical protein